MATNKSKHRHEETISLRRRIVLLLLSGFLFAGITLSMLFFASQSVSQQSVTAPVLSANSISEISYQGKTGKNALELLEEKTAVEKDQSGLVTSISGRKADTSSKEYWAFYVNGALSPVGPAGFQTKDSDTLMWRMETY